MTLKIHLRNPFPLAIRLTTMTQSPKISAKIKRQNTGANSQQVRLPSRNYTIIFWRRIKTNLLTISAGFMTTVFGADCRTIRLRLDGNT